MKRIIYFTNIDAPLHSEYYNIYTNMNLFIDSISNDCFLAFFDINREIIAKKTLDIKGNESSKLIPEIMSFFSDNSMKQSELENIVVVNGPGSFTGVRTVVLIANTMNFVLKKNMTSINYFDLFSEYPIIKSSSKRDCFFKKSPDSSIEIIPNDEIEYYLSKNNIAQIYGEFGSQFENTRIVEKIDYSDIIKNIKLTKEKKIEPLYIKKPNIF